MNKAELDTIDEETNTKNNSEMITDMIDEISMETVETYGFQVLIVISTFLPWVTISGGGQSLTIIGATSDLSWVLIALTAFTVIMEMHESEFWTPVVRLGTSIAMFLTVILFWFNFNTAIRESMGNQLGIVVNASVGIGFWLAVIGVIGYSILSYKQYESESE